MTRKVMKPKGWDPKKITPGREVWVLPKIDGCRMYNPEGIALARTQKKHRNAHVTGMFSHEHFIGFDGEVAAERETHPDLCRITSSALSTAEGTPFVFWHIFDYVTDETAPLPYKMRYAAGEAKLMQLRSFGYGDHLLMVPYKVCTNLEQVQAAHEHYMGLGYEGSCVWDPAIVHKEGDSSPTHRGVVRIKDFIDSEILVTQIVEGDKNNNEAQTNELGKTFRTSHQENKEPNGMVGGIIGIQQEDVFDLYDKKKQLLKKGDVVTLSPGNMPHDMRLHYFRNPAQIIGKLAKYKFFPKGIKDKPRFPQFASIRSKEDL